MGTLTFKQNYFGDKAAFDGLVGLLHDVFGIDIGLQEKFGGPDLSSVPFGYFDDAGRCVANFSAFAMPLMINGKLVKAAGYQSGAVRPEYRGQGLYRDLMQKAFAWATASGFSVGCLLTDKPSLYERYGFRVIAQHVFGGPPPDFSAQNGKSRALDLENPADVAIISKILEDRQPVSNRFAVAGQKEMFLLNACFDPSITLTHIPDLSIIVAWKRSDDGRLQLLDIAGQAIPKMREILSHLNLSTELLEVHFPTDRLEWQGQPMAYQGNCSLMVSGLSQDIFTQPLMLSPMAEF